MVVIAILAVFTLLSSAEANKKTECPPEELVPFCTCERDSYNYDCKFLIFGCKKGYRLSLNCTEAVNERNFLNILHSLEDYKVHEVEYHNLNMRTLPRGSLKYHPVAKVVIRESVISGLQSDNGSEMFAGATETLKKFHLRKVEGANSWRWTAFGVLRELDEFEVSSSDLTQVGPEFNALPNSLRNMDFSGNRISHISNDAISRQHQLLSLNFRGNKISEISRSMFPDPADLQMFSLGHNKIKDLPEEIFRNIPNLWLLDLSSNNIKWLPPSVFEPISDEALVLLEGNIIYCCGAQERIVETKLQKKFIGTCYAPGSLAGKEIYSLTTEDLRHGIC